MPFVVFRLHFSDSLNFGNTVAKLPTGAVSIRLLSSIDTGAVVKDIQDVPVAQLVNASPELQGNVEGARPALRTPQAIHFPLTPPSFPRVTHPLRRLKGQRNFAAAVLLPHTAALAAAVQQQFFFFFFFFFF
jgi:hypothetical protein